MARRPGEDYVPLVSRRPAGVSSFAGIELALTNFAMAASMDPFAASRMRMVQEQLIGPGRGLSNPRVLSAMANVPRHEFVPEPSSDLAYADRPLPIGCGQTISQPYIVALMTEHLAPQPTDRVLEIGTGSGYQTAVLAGLVAEVYTVEIIEPLATRAAAALKRLGCTNVLARTGDGFQGWPEAAPFDGIIVTCAPDTLPPPLIEQLADGGRMIIPVGETPDQELVLLRKRGHRLERINVLPVRFVPMTGAAQPGNVFPPPGWQSRWC